MPSTSPNCDPSPSWCLKTPRSTFDSAVIRGWLADQPDSPRSSQKRAHSPFLQTQHVKRRRPLQPTHANMSRRSPRRKNNAEQISPARQSQHRENDVQSDEGYAEENAMLEENATTPKPERRGRPHRLAQLPLDLAAFSVVSNSENVVPSSSYSNALAHRPILYPSNTNSSASSAQSGKSRPKRANSPAKTYSDLQLLNKPVRYGVMDLEQENLPEDIRVLVEDLQGLCENAGIIPSSIQDRVPGAKKRSHWAYETDRDDLDLMIELDAMKRVHAAAISLSTTGDHEPQWYCSVQWPLLDMAFRHQLHIEPKQISHALPVKECLPRTGDRYSDSRLVDFAVNLVPQTVPNDFLSEWLRNQPDNLRTVNQSVYPPLCRHPTIISVEVKVNGTEEEARVQVGIWVSAWHERVRQLTTDENYRVITLPIIVVLNHHWHLYFAVDKGTHIEILQFTESMGDTLSVVKIYRILAVLRRLGEWGLKTFEPWFVSTYLNLA